MLVKLFVQNYALIKELDVGLENGLTIITGETGAGKTILLGALSLILGTRADTNVLLDKNEKCIVEGTFRIDEYDLNDFFTGNELDYDPVTILRREINPAGKSRAFINDTPVKINLLKDLGDRLIDIHSQHQTLMLSDNSFQLNVIDSFAGNSKIKNDYRIVYNSYRKLKREYNEIREKAEKNRADLEYYQFQLNQLEEAKLLSGEQTELEKDQEILEHTEEIKAALAGSSALLSSEETSVLALLRELKLNIGKIKTFLPDAESLFSRADSTYIELNDLTNDIERLSAKIEADPGRLQEINDRLDLIYSLIQKHRVKDVNELIIKHEELKKMVKTIVTSDERLEELEKLLEKELHSLKVLADEISSNRINIVPDVENKINELLKQLGMPNGKFRIEINRSHDFTPSGIDFADFLFSANKQVPPENIAKVASGGELSRVMLSLKSCLTKNNNLPTIIFDEIDSGVSGEVADKVGQILAEMGKYMQVINITHLPQVASRGKKHYHVYKDDTGDSTITRIRLLSQNERILEVAKLLSGSEVTETALKNARELLKAIEQYQKSFDECDHD
jgi:DNA repair protein RecN (Recombination protein N)